LMPDADVSPWLAASPANQRRTEREFLLVVTRRPLMPMSEVFLLAGWSVRARRTIGVLKPTGELFAVSSPNSGRS